MKKKLIVLVALVLVVAVMTSLLVGCDEIFKKNETRDANQVVASVSYKGVTANVYKFELESSFNNYAYIYVNYYGLTYEAATEYLLRSLAQQRLVTLYAKDVVLDYMKSEHADKIKSGLTYETVTSRDLLSPAEVDHAIEHANESMLSSLKSIIKSAISEDNYNASEQTSSETVEVTDPITVSFESNEGSEVASQEIQKGSVAKEPTDPTRTGYVFYGWYLAEDFSGEEFDFDTKLAEDTTLYAKWVEYLAPRTVKAEVEEEEPEFDPADYEEVDLRALFFSDEYQATLFDEIKDDEAIANMQVPDTSTFDETLKTYINEGLATLKKNLVNNVHRADFNACYDYYLENQMDSLLVEKLEQVIGKGVTVTKEEVESEFALAVEKNKEAFGASSSAYSSALTSALEATYYHTALDPSYGFVVNILLKLDDEAVSALSDRYTNYQNKEMVRIERNRAVSEMQINVSNPDYDSTAKVLDEDGNEIELRDPMTDPNNPYLAEGTEYNKDNDYSKIISFEKDDEGNFYVSYNAVEHPAMAYLTKKVYAFDVDGNVGIIHQINNSLNQVKAAVANGEISHIEGVYWLREVATAWLYLVGDDSGAVSSDSNNGGLGYLVTPAGETSNYLEDFTTYARDLISEGTGAFEVVTVTDADFAGATADGELAGNFKAYVVADNIGSSSAYAGVFVLLASDRVWDETVYT
ncbi:MAG: InlB B-repeat-containing protein, partial [Clostridia bacterium]|nr:InlB B-repeat-containing protein [Clostridia bacterium]